MNFVFWFTEKVQIILLITIIILINLKFKKIRKIEEDEQLEKNEIKKHKKKIKILFFKGIIVFISWFLLKFIVSIISGGGNYIISETDLILSPYVRKFNSFVFFQSFICWSILFGVYVINLINIMIREHCNKKIKIIPGTFKIMIVSVIFVIILEAQRIIQLVDFLHNTVPTISGITLNDAMDNVVCYNFTYSVSTLEISNIAFIIFLFIWYYILKKKIAKMENDN